MKFKVGYTYILKDTKQVDWLPKRLKIEKIEEESDTIHALMEPRDKPVAFGHLSPQRLEDHNLERISMTGGIWDHYTLDLNQTLEDIKDE